MFNLGLPSVEPEIQAQSPHTADLSAWRKMPDGIAKYRAAKSHLQFLNSLSSAIAFSGGDNTGSFDQFQGTVAYRSYIMKMDGIAAALAKGNAPQWQDALAAYNAGKPYNPLFESVFSSIRAKAGNLAAPGKLTQQGVMGFYMQNARDDQASVFDKVMAVANTALLSYCFAQAGSQLLNIGGPAPTGTEAAPVATGSESIVAGSGGGGSSFGASIDLGSQSLTNTAINEGLTNTVGQSITGSGISLTSNAVGTGLTSAGITGSVGISAATSDMALIEASTTAAPSSASSLITAAEKQAISAAEKALLSKIVTAVNPKATPAPAAPAASESPQLPPELIVIGLLAFLL